MMFLGCFHPISFFLPFFPSTFVSASHSIGHPETVTCFVVYLTNFFKKLEILKLQFNKIMDLWICSSVCVVYGAL